MTRYMMNPVKDKFSAIVLAGDRSPDDPLITAGGVNCKALLPIAGRPMILSVLDALENSTLIGNCIVTGSSAALLGQSKELDSLFETGKIRFIENESTPSLSAQKALQHLSADQPVLLTTADHALLTPEIIDYFCAAAIDTGCDAVAALAHAEEVGKAFPGSRRTVTRLRDGGYCGCNLFAFLTTKGRDAAKFWRKVEEHRKRPLKIARILGIFTMLRYLTGHLSLDDALARLSRLIGARAGAIWMPYPEASVDVDKIDDWKLVENFIAANRL